MPTATAVLGGEYEAKIVVIRDDSPSSESLVSASPSPTSRLLPPDEQPDAEVAALFSSQPKLYGATHTGLTDYPDTDSVLSDIQDPQYQRTDSATSMASGYDSDREAQPLSLSSSHSACSRRKFCEYNLSFWVVGVRMAGKVLMTYYGAKVFVEHSSFVRSLAALAWITQNIIPAITGVQNYFMGGSSGHKTVKSLMRTPRLELQSLKTGLCKHPLLSSLVLLRLIGDAVLRGSVIHHILSDKCGGTAAWIMAVSIAGLNALCDIKFTAASDFRLLKRLSTSLTCQQARPIDLLPSEKAKVSSILCDKAGVLNDLDVALNDLTDCETIRHYVRTADFQRAYFDNNPHPNKVQKWRFIQTKNELVVRASRYSRRVELSARLTSLAVNLPFLYLAFVKNQSFVGQFAAYEIALVWGCVSCALKTLTTQGKAVEGLSDSYAGLGSKTCGRVKRVAYEKPYAMLFCCLDILPFGIFGAGQILDMPHKLPWLGDKGAKALLVIFAVTQLNSYCCFVAPRVTKRMPACMWSQKKAPLRGGYKALDDVTTIAEHDLPAAVEIHK
ncbi:MAG: hypothetical protein P1U34_00470 [Coxiellaceae bacterium]|nr:hypothetical protein [Coxiellaceae bacterium]